VAQRPAGTDLARQSDLQLRQRTPGPENAVQIGPARIAIVIQTAQKRHITLGDPTQRRPRLVETVATLIAGAGQTIDPVHRDEIHPAGQARASVVGLERRADCMLTT